jgi:FkbM family methyltransferase
MKLLPRRFERVEVGLIVMAAIAATMLVMRPPPSPPPMAFSYTDSEAIYRDTYGGKKFSTNAEEWLIRDFFQDRRDGVFLDVGASHHEEHSNTYFLETVLGWSGLAIDAQAEYADGYRRSRPRTRFVAAFVSDTDDETIPFYVPGPGENLRVASGSQRFVEGATGVGEVRNVPTVTLNRVLDAAGIRRIDLLNLDIELFEAKALAGFDIDRFQPDLVCVEAHLPVRQAILDYFMEHGYVVVGKYLRADTQNLYFTRYGARQETSTAATPTNSRSSTLP